MVTILAGALGLLAALIAHDLAAQSLTEQSLVPLAGTCPNCGTRRGWFRRECPRCERSVGREFIVLGVGPAVAIGFANTVGTTWALLAYLGFLVLSLALAITDIDSFRIVDRLNLRGTAFLILLLGLTSLLDSNSQALWRALLASLAYFGGTNLMYVLVRGRGFGYGDVKLSVQLGLFSGYISWGTLGWSVLLTALIGGLMSVVILAGGALRRRKQIGEEAGLRDALKVELPYGPAMIVGCWLAVALAGLGAFPVPA